MLCTGRGTSSESTPHLGQVFETAVTGDRDTLLWPMHLSGAAGPRPSAEDLNAAEVDRLPERARTAATFEERGVADRSAPGRRAGLPRRSRSGPPAMRLAGRILHRAGPALIVPCGVPILIFPIARVLPGDPARAAPGPSATADQVAALRAARGLQALAYPPAHPHRARRRRNAGRGLSGPGGVGLAGARALRGAGDPAQGPQHNRRHRAGDRSALHPGDHPRRSPEGAHPPADPPGAPRGGGHAARARASRCRPADPGRRGSGRARAVRGRPCRPDRPFPDHRGAVADFTGFDRPPPRPGTASGPMSRGATWSRA